MVKDQGSKVKKKKFTKIYYLLLVPVIALGLLVIPWITSANQTAIDIKSFPEFIPDEQSVIEEGMELSAENYLPLATTEVESGQKLDMASLPGTVKAEILVSSDGSEGETTFATDIVDITAEWDASKLDLKTPGVYNLDLKLPGDYNYEGVLPYVAVEVKQAETAIQPDEQTDGEVSPKAEQSGEETTNNAQQDENEGPLPTGEQPVGAEQPTEDTLVPIDGQQEEQQVKSGTPCNHGEGCTVVCEDENNCTHVCDSECGGVASMEIQQFCGIYPNGNVMARYTVKKGDTSAFVAEKNISAYMTDGSLAEIPIKWAGSYDIATPGTYRVTMEIGGGYIWNGPNMVAEIFVYDNDESGR